MNESKRVTVRIGGRITVSCDVKVSMPAHVYEELHAKWMNQEPVDEELLLDWADVLRRGYTDDPEVDDFELVKTADAA